MTTEKYEPVSCDQHDVLEAAATRGDEVELEYESNGEVTRQRGKIEDVWTSDGEEHVRLKAGNGETEIRLDRIRNVRNLTQN